MKKLGLRDHKCKCRKDMPFKAYPADQNVKSITFGIDLIILSSTESKETIEKALIINGFKQKKDEWVPKGSFERSATYKKGADELSIHYYQRRAVGYVDVLMYLPCPEKEFMHTLARIFSDYKIQYNFSRMRLAWMFDVADADKFQEYLAARVFLKRSLTPCEEGGGAFYANDGRRSVKSVAVAMEEFNGRWVVKLILKLSNAAMKTYGISFPPDPASIDFKPLFEFKKLDLDKLYAYLLESKCKKPRKRVLLDIADELEGQVREVFEKRPLMATIEYLRSKNISRYSRFLEPMEREDALIKRAVRDKFVDCIGK